MKTLLLVSLLMLFEDVYHTGPVKVLSVSPDAKVVAFSPDPAPPDHRASRLVFCDAAPFKVGDSYQDLGFQRDPEKGCLDIVSTKP